MPRQAHLFRYARLLSVLIGLLAIVIVMGACAISSQAGTSTGGSGGTSTGPTATATTPGEAGGATDPTPTATTATAPTKTPTPPIICCITILLPSVHQVLHQQTLSGTSVGPVTATCPAGEIALSGSWATNPSDGSNALVYNSSRNGAGGWNVYVQHSGSTLVNAYAMCLKNAAGASVAERFAGSLSVSPNTYGSKFASCNAGETLVGGAFASNNGLTLYNFTASGSTWGGYVWNHTGSALPFNFYAECLTYSGSHSSFVGAQATGHATSPTCPSGNYVSGGGFAANSNSQVFTMSATSSGQAWEVYDTPASLLNAYALCLSL